MVEARIDRYPEGPIFRTKRKTKWVTEAVSVNLQSGPVESVAWRSSLGSVAFELMRC
jgi:hypothetical protein